MKIEEGCNTREVTILETVYELPLPFTPEMFSAVPEGLADAETMAKKSNQTLTEDLTNNLRSRMKVMQKEGKDLMTQEEVNAYISEYMPGVRTSSGPSVSPIEARALSLAKRDLKKQLKAKKDLTVAKKGVAQENVEPGQIAFDKFEDMAHKMLEKYPAYMEKAEAQLKDEAESVIDIEL